MKPKEIIAEIIDRIPCVERPGHNMLAHEIVKKLEAGGYAIVPREPTEAMIEASNREWDGRMSHRSSGAWQAMLDAARAHQ